ncbi:zinc finger BED domain-containing protein 5-like [Photinus pyralis]|uniref:zinc finger BED domain-containing protein 5-like n=1 Tax=Photinus pyralis TaxID=7054 RepID=UPI00126736E8|nr:zinc finger BED domain-containing protein 5-like [Photinus pyralis]
MDKWLNIATSSKRSCARNPIPSTSTSESDCAVIQDDKVPTKIRKLVRKYDPEYINIGFTVTDVNNEPRPQCVICFEILSNQSMKPSLLNRHLTTKHNALVNKPKDFFIRKLSEMKGTKNIMSSFTGSTEKSVEASFLVSLRIAKSGKAHTIGEELVLPAAKDMVTCMLGEKSAKKLDMISLSNDTVRRRIETMALNVKNQLIDRVKRSEFFAIQLDESTDVTNYAQLMVYVRYIHANTIKEDYLFCEALPTRTTADEIFKKLSEFFAENGLDWMNCVGFCSDGARAMTGKFGGVATKVKSVADSCTFMHCNIHRQALAVKCMPEQFKHVLQETIKVVNFIKSRALNSRLFSKLCSEMGSDHIQLLLHTEVRWLSRGKMLSRLFELRSEVQLFLMETDFELRDRLTDELWITTLAYLSDIFNRINDLNLSLQGKTTNRFSVNDKIKAFIKKFQMINNIISNNHLESFSTLENFVAENSLTVSDDFIEDIKKHCQMLIETFEEYFKEDYSEFLRIRNPFTLDVNNVPENLTISEKECLIELSCDEGLRAEFTKLQLCEFWLKVKNEYPPLSRRALLFLIPFTTTYLVRADFLLCYF